MKSANIQFKKSKTAALLFTGGKDSCLALLKAEQQGYKIKYLLTVMPATYDSWMFHKSPLGLLKEQANVLGLPLLTQKTQGKKESELKDLEILIKKIKDKVEYIITGGVASSYQKSRIEKISKKLSLKIVLPLEGMDSEGLWKEALKNKFEIILTKIACEGIPASWLGQLINKSKFNQLAILSKQYGFSLEGEGGDFETTVLYMPLFKYKIKIKARAKSESAYRHFLLISTVSKKI